LFHITMLMGSRAPACPCVKTALVSLPSFPIILLLYVTFILLFCRQQNLKDWPWKPGRNRNEKQEEYTVYSRALLLRGWYW